MKVKKLVASLLSILLVVLFSTLNVSAALWVWQGGDVDGEGEITVKDATMIQKHIASIIDFDKEQKVIADVDGDKNVTVKDVTMIQKRCAGIIDTFPVERVPYNTEINSFNADFDSGRAMVGVPVEFMVLIYNEVGITYEYFINGETVSEPTSDNSFTYTFDEAGVYTVKVEATTVFGDMDSATFDYVVVDAYVSDTVKVKAFYHDQTEKPFDDIHNHTGTTFTADAMFGSGEYEYAFYVDGELVQDFSEKSTYTHHWFKERREYTLSVEVRDTVTGDVDSESMVILVEEPIMG